MIWPLKHIWRCPQSIDEITVPGGKCDNAGALQKVSLVPRLVVPSFQDDGFHCSVQNKLCRR